MFHQLHSSAHHTAMIGLLCQASQYNHSHRGTVHYTAENMRHKRNTMQSTSSRPVMGFCGSVALLLLPLLLPFLLPVPDDLGGSCSATPLGCTCAASAAVN